VRIAAKQANGGAQRSKGSYAKALPGVSIGMASFHYLTDICLVNALLGAGRGVGADCASVAENRAFYRLFP
jgi:hypothetical protein